ncbi:Uncharacterised protein [Mycobacteroides abscessus subsp. abscessus]|nr:Uncharacterised protein [Mycobacteroides abscessus subsp. abscessus]
MPVTGGRVCRSTPLPMRAPSARANGTIHGAPERFSAPLASDSRTAAHSRRCTDPPRG